MTGPELPISQQLHAEKYRSEGESFREAMNRVGNALSDDDNHYKKFRDSLLNMRFLPAGRVQSAMGSIKAVTPYNCYVSGTIEDSFVDGHGSIMERAKEAAATMRMGGGIGYDFSTLRPRGALIKKLQSMSSGPISFMDIFDSVCRCVASSGHRRGAQMGVLRVDHPDIEQFIHAKQNDNRLQGFNVSIAVTDEFMQCVEHDRPFNLKWNNEVYNTIDAAALWEMIMRSTWDWAEPGVLFIDRINALNNLWYCEQIAATNPCGEQPLPPYGACLLGSFNLTRYARPRTVFEINQPRWEFDWDMFKHDIPHVVRAMDNVVDRAIYPLYEQEKEAKNKRRMGLGITGFANMSEAMGFPYGSEQCLKFEEDVLRMLNNECYRTSAKLSKEKGNFPMYSGDQYLQSKFLEVLDEDVLHAISKDGMRNSHLTSIAPTGTISLCADNPSSGIEPVYEYEVERTIKTFEGEKIEKVQDYGVRVFGVEGKKTSQVSAKEHVDVLTTAAKLVDSAVSKTCNVSPDMPWEDFKNIYVSAWKGGAKGCTTFNPGGKRMGIFKESEDEEPKGESCEIDPTTGRRDCG